MIFKNEATMKTPHPQLSIYWGVNLQHQQLKDSKTCAMDELKQSSMSTRVPSLFLLDSYEFPTLLPAKIPAVKTDALHTRVFTI